MDLCPNCPGRLNPLHPPPVPPDGPTPCPIMFIGEGPAKDEVRFRTPFKGRAGREFNDLYLPLAGLSRPEVYVTNASKCAMPKWNNPTKEHAQTCADYHLHYELRQVNPLVIVPMGAVACSLFHGQLDLESQHGIPFYGSLYDWEGVVFPTYHPALGLHVGEWMQVLMDDFRALQVVLDGIMDAPVDQYPNPEYQEVDSIPLLDYSLSTPGPAPSLALDTEATPRSSFGSVIQRWNPYCFSYTLRPGEGFVIYLDRPELVNEFCHRITSLDLLLVFHNYLFDAPICQSIGIPIRRFDDTMIRAYNLQNIPRGLKPLAYRLCGMHMDSFNDVVTPHSCARVMEWAAISIEILSDIIYTHHGKPTKSYPLGKPLLHPRRRPEFTVDHARTYNKLSKLMDDCYSIDPWKRWRDWHPHDRDFISSLVSSIPPRSIAHCPRVSSTPYACADADATMRILPHLRRLATNLRNSVEVS